MRLWNYDTNQAEEVDDSQALSLIQSGAYAPLKNTQYDLTHPQYGNQQITGEGLEEQLSQGAMVTTDEQKRKRALQQNYGSTLDQFKAVGIGALEGMTSGGISNWALTETGVDPETISGLKEANPKANLLGEGIGLGLSFYNPAAATTKVGKALQLALKTASAPTRAALKVGELTAQGLEKLPLIAKLEKEGALVTRAATKALTAGAGAAFENTMYRAGQLVSEEALGEPDLNAEHVVSELGASALLGFTAGGLFAGVPKLVTGAAKEGTERIAGSIGTREWAENVADDAAMQYAVGRNQKLRQKAEHFDSYKDMAKYVKDKIRNGPFTGTSLDDLGVSIKGDKDLIGQKLGSFVQQADELAVKGGPEGVTKGKPSPVDWINRDELVARMQKEVLAPIKGKIGANETAAYIEKRIQDIADHPDEYISFAKGVEARQVLQNELPADPTSISAAKKVAVDDMRKIWNDEVEKRIDKVLERHDKAVAGDYVKTKREFAMLNDLTDAVEKNRLRELNQPIKGLGMGEGVYAGVGAALGGAPGAAAAAMGRSWIQENKEMLAFRLADNFARLGSIDNLVKRSADKLDNLTKIFDQPKGVGAAAAILTDEQAEKQIEQVHYFANAPEQWASHVQQRLSGVNSVAPKTSLQIGLHANRVLNYLKTTAPKKYRSLISTPIDNYRKYTPSDLAKWKIRISVADKPTAVLDAFRHNTLTKTHLEALDAMYPRLGPLFREKMISAAIDSKRKFSYHERVKLSLLTGAPFAKLMEPQNVQLLQASYAGTPENPEQTALNLSASVTKNLDLAESQETSLNRIGEGLQS